MTSERRQRQAKAERELRELAEADAQIKRAVSAEADALIERGMSADYRPVVCQECGEKIEPGMKNCPCGGKLTTDSPRKQCPKCKEWIDKSATKCPHCRSSQPAPAWATVLAVLIAVGLGVWVFQSCLSIFSLSPETKARLDAEKQREEQYGSKSMAWVMAQDFVKERLVSPGSADFGGMFEQRYKDCVTDLGDGRYLVRGWVDSQNRFGAKMRSNFRCTLKYVGNDKWRCESIDIVER